MRRLLVILALVLLVGAACGSTTSTNKGPGPSLGTQAPSDTVAGGDHPLVGTTWTVTSLIDDTGVTAVPTGVSATLELSSDTQIAWNACNRYAGSVTVTDTTITMGQIQSTLMACPGPGTDVEAAMGSVLAGTVDYQIEGSVLHLRNGTRGVDLQAS